MNWYTPKVASKKALMGLAILSLANAIAVGQSAPTAPQVTSGTYTVTFQAVPGAAATYLEERVGASGSWLTVSNTLYVYSGSNMSVAFSGKSAGQYFYRVNALFAGYYGNTWWQTSGETLVTVNSGPAPTQDRITNEHAYTYVARYGHSMATDCMTCSFHARREEPRQRDAGAGDTPESREWYLMLLMCHRRDKSAPLHHGQCSIRKSNWGISISTVSSTILLPELGNVLGGVGQSTSFRLVPVQGTQPQRVIAMDAKVNKFLADTAVWQEDIDYYVHNAPTMSIPVY